MTRLVFLDTETTSLDRYTRRIWDIAYIIRDKDHKDTEKQFFLDPNLKDADPMSLRIGGYYQRHPNFNDGHYENFVSTPMLVRTVVRDFMDAVIVGAVPSFDEETLARLCHESGNPITWHYHLLDIESFAAGLLGMEPPWNFDKVLANYGVGYRDGADRHTALGDARIVRDLYDATLAAHR